MSNKNEKAREASFRRLGLPIEAYQLILNHIEKVCNRFQQELGIAEEAEKSIILLEKYCRDIDEILALSELEDEKSSGHSMLLMLRDQTKDCLLHFRGSHWWQGQYIEWLKGGARKNRKFHDKFRKDVTYFVVGEIIDRIVPERNGRYERGADLVGQLGYGYYGNIPNHQGSKDQELDNYRNTLRNAKSYLNEISQKELHIELWDAKLESMIDAGTTEK